MAKITRCGYLLLFAGQALLHVPAMPRRILAALSTCLPQRKMRRNVGFEKFQRPTAESLPQPDGGGAGVSVEGFDTAECFDH